MIERIILVDMDNTLCDWEGAFEEMMTKHYPDVPLVSRSQRMSWNHADDYPEEYREIVNQGLWYSWFFRKHEGKSRRHSSSQGHGGGRKRGQDCIGSSSRLLRSVLC